MLREAEVNRTTKETDISIGLKLDAKPMADIETGIGFFDHMLTAFAIHSSISLEIKVKGDLYVDCHHTIEDTGIALGQAIDIALDDKGGICRYGEANIPMDEALGFASLDISGRSFLVFNAQWKADKIGEMDCQMIEEFFRALCMNAGITLHISALYGNNDHHKAEAMFKAFAHAFKAAVAVNSDGKVLSTKGVL